MNEIMEQITEIAKLQLLNQNVSGDMEKLKQQFGVAAVERAVRKTGYYCILNEYVEVWEAEKRGDNNKK